MNPPALQHIRVVLSHTSHPGNIGSAARAMKTMGLSRLYLVNPREFPSAQADTLASSAVDILRQAVVCTSLAQALSGTVFAAALSARRRDLTLPDSDAREAAGELVALATTGEVALVFGNETSGLSNEEVLACNRLVQIPANPEYSSLNLAAAVQLLGYELRMAAGAGQIQRNSRTSDLATQDDMAGLYAHLEAALIDIGYLDPAQPKRLMPRLKRLFNRVGLEREELNLLRGILKLAQAPRHPGNK